MRPAVLACTLACAMGHLAACNTSVHGVTYGPLDASPHCEAAKTHSDLTFIQTDIFDRSCSVSASCHGGTTGDEAANLLLTDGKSYAQLLGQAAQSPIAMMHPHSDGSAWQRVVPFDAANSYLMVLVDPKTNPRDPSEVDPDGFDGPVDPMAGAMPSGNPLLCPEEIAAIQRWIESGAPNN